MRTCRSAQHDDAETNRTHCPICDHCFDSQAVVSTNSFGGKRTDFHERAAGTQPLPYLIHLVLALRLLRR